MNEKGEEWEASFSKNSGSWVECIIAVPFQVYPNNLLIHSDSGYTPLMWLCKANAFLAVQEYVSLPGFCAEEIFVATKKRISHHSSPGLDSLKYSLITDGFDIPGLLLRIIDENGLRSQLTSAHIMHCGCFGRVLGAIF